MISYDDALDIILASDPLGAEEISIKQAAGRVTAEPVICGVNVPPFDNSAMDGFAVYADSLSKVTPDKPVSLDVEGSSAAGDHPGDGVNGAWEIMTGAPMPAGYDTVVKIEDVQVEGGQVTFSKVPVLGSNIRRIGQDFAKGQEIIKVGTSLTPYHLMALATIGQGEVQVSRSPRISIFSTGKELVEDFDVELKPGQIRSSNGILLETALKNEGYDTFYGGIIHDEPHIFEEKIKDRLLHSDIIISTGAVSAGKYDFIPSTIGKLGAEVKFHKVLMQPGKPIFYAQFKTGQHFFGLPGNPISAAIGVRFFILPLLRNLQGCAQERVNFGRLKNSAMSKPQLTLFRKAYMRSEEDGSLQVQILDGQESFKINPMLTANCWAVIEPHKGDLKAGDIVQVYPLFSKYNEASR